jgi:hypothetical protein
MSPKAKKDWFRRRTWTESDRQEFEATLKRARRHRVRHFGAVFSPFQPS